MGRWMRSSIIASRTISFVGMNGCVLFPLGVFHEVKVKEALYIISSEHNARSSALK